MDARQDDVLGITRLLHMALTGFGGVLGFDVLTFVVDARPNDVLGIT